ncbi:MAG: ATP-dependent RecD-like DNA helicase [Chlamydiia bacterium]
MHETLTGTIDHIVYQNEENGYTVARLKSAAIKEPVVIVGNLMLVAAGEIITCDGTFKHHPSFGRQFVVDTFEVCRPKDLKGIERYLESGVIKGIGPTYAKRIVDTFGMKTFDILDGQIDRLQEVEGIGEKKLDKIRSSWTEQGTIRQVMVFLRGHNVSLSLAQKIYRRYKETSLDVIQNNPYQLARDIPGIGFKTADSLAKEIGIGLESEERVQSGIEHILRVLCDEGHSCFPLTGLIEHGKNLLEVEEELISKQIQPLMNSQRLVGIHTHPNSDEMTLWTKPMFRLEMTIVEELQRIRNHPCSLREVNCDKAIEWVEGQLQLQFAEEQKIAITKSMQEKLHIITGGPGTGKSTITKAILALSEKITNKILLAAPTGRAAKRLSDITKKKALTIHSLLEMDFVSGGFKRNRTNSLACELIIIDEASMIDTSLMASLLKAIPSSTRVILIGDIDQLPSVGPGSVLKDLIESDTIATTRLKEIFRQAKGSRIVRNAHRVNQGQFPEIDEDPNSDFWFIPLEKPEEILSKIVQLVAKQLPDQKGFHPFEEIQVLSPMKKGVLGTFNINIALQDRLNPSQKRVTKMGRTFRLGDKVMQIRNNYDKAVFNGDVGRIVEIDETEETLTVLFDGHNVSYNFVEIDELILAYAVSVHKYQGSECPVIVMPIHTSHFKLLVKNLVYTGITRGKRLVVLVGSKRAIAIAVKSVAVDQRFTGLKHFLIQNLDKLTPTTPHLRQEMIFEETALQFQ